jgi:hypothetical protein
VEVEILDGGPSQVNAIIRGQLPDGGCTTISSVDQVRNGNTFNIQLMTTTDPLAICTLAATPFEKIVPLNPQIWGRHLPTSICILCLVEPQQAVMPGVRI